MLNTSKFNIYNILAGVILLTMFLIMIFSSVQDSATMDELAHIPSAYSYIKYKDMRLNPEHPPLLKDLSGIFMSFLDLNFPINDQSWQKDINGQWRAGSLFLYESGNNPEQIIFFARLGAMLLTIILGWLIFKWSREIFNPKAAVLSLILYAFSPTILAHGRLVTTDISAAFGIIIGTYYFLKWLKNQTAKNLIFAGIAFGIAQLAKFSAFLLVPYFILLTIIWIIIYSSFKIKQLSLSIIKTAAKTAIIFAIGYLFIVWPVYGLHTLNYPPEKQLRDTSYILSSYAGKSIGIQSACLNISNIKRCPAEITIWMADKSYLHAFGQYMLGLLMVFQRQSGGNTGYFFGEITNAGWKSYFPLVYLIKEQLSLHLMTLVAIFSSFSILLYKEKKIVSASLNIKTKKEKIIGAFKLISGFLRDYFEIFAIIIFIAVYFYVSIRGNLNIGIRHLIPAIVLIYILVGGGLQKWLNQFKEISLHPQDQKHISYLSLLKNQISHYILKLEKQLAVSILFVWYVGSTIFIFPNFLPYFNELIGTNNGYKFVVDSNYDWGQDLKRLAKWVEDNNLKSIGIHYFGGGKPEYYIKNAKVIWWWDIERLKVSKFQSLNSNEELPKYFAVSATFTQYANGEPINGFERKYEPWFSWIQGKQPIARAGYSIFIYELEQ